jgi:hypothetical protein
LLAASPVARAQHAVVKAAVVPALQPEAVGAMAGPRAEVAPEVLLALVAPVVASRAWPLAVAEPRAWPREAAVEGQHAAAVRMAPQALPAAARLLAAASLCPPDRVLPWPVPLRWVRFARATRSLQIASL